MLNKKRQLAFTLLKYTQPSEGVLARLPEAYKKFDKELNETPPKPVHYECEPGKWKKDPKTGEMTPVQNVALPTLLPKQLHSTLLGGEMVIRGFQKRRPMARRVPHFWVPQLQRSVVYSEILNKHFSAIVTPRLILQIHEYKGFDNYLLQNLACDLRTNLALKIKKSVLTALLNKDLPYDAEKNQEIYEKYKQFILPNEELEWYGLSPQEAIQKQLDLEEAERRNVTPLKHQLRLELIEELKTVALEEAQQPKDEKPVGWLSKIARPFAPKAK